MAGKLPMLSPPAGFPAKNFWRSQMRCDTCGAAIRPWLEVCYQCYNPTSSDMKIAEPIMARNFMQKMGIDGWK